ncbi:MAG TPA: hypothetical protein VGR54_07300 [Nitrosopumilaceae archaeon]|nr:hypothetical protein [Nitrosopumilaceae archaeon]
MKVIYLTLIVAAIAVILVPTSFTYDIFVEAKQTASQAPTHNTEPASSNHTAPRKDVDGEILTAIIRIEGKKETVNIQLSRVLFKVNPHYDRDGEVTSLDMTLRPEMHDKYKKIGFAEKSKKTVFVYPIFTQAAYGNNGFYDYYKKRCDTKCLTVNIPTKFQNTYTASGTAGLVLKLLNYSHITDIEVDKNPDILKKYDRIIILHNEYVTKKEFDAITHHPNVVYLYPNALYAEVKTDYNKNTIILVRGHGYPSINMANGFGWKYDNSKLEYDVKCENWKFYKINNGKMLNCYPEIAIASDQLLLGAIKN